MHAIIVYFSVSGKNKQVAEAVERELKGKGLTTETRSLKPKRSMGVVQRVLRSVFGRSVELSDPGTVADGELLVLAGPVWASPINPPMRAFLDLLPELKGRRVINLVCGFNPHPEVVNSINRRIETLHAGPVVSRAICLGKIDSPDKTATLVSEIVTQALA